MKKLLPILLLVMIIPQIALAAWWNPFSWGNDTVDDKAELLERIAELEQKVDSKSDNQETAVELPKPEERIVTQTIKVDNPELQLKIDALIKESSQLKTENLSLNSKIFSLTNSINQCKTDLASESAQTNSQITIDSADIERKKKLESVDAKIIPILDSFYNVAIEYGNGSSMPQESFPNIQTINTYLGNYRIVIDNNFDHLDLSLNMNANDKRNALIELRAYLKTYIEYR